MQTKKKCQLNCPLCEDPESVRLHEEEDFALHRVAEEAIKARGLLNRISRYVNIRSQAAAPLPDAMTKEILEISSSLATTLDDFFNCLQSAPQISRVVESLQYIECSLVEGVE